MKYSGKDFLSSIVVALALLNCIPSTGFAGSSGAPVKRSIRDWVTCNGTTDDNAGVARAFAAARNSAFTLLVDCPVRIHIGKDITRPLFIDSGTTVQFEGTGKFTVDNIFIPAFVIANSSKISLEGWNVEWDASLPVNVNTSGFLDNGKTEKGLAGNAFSDVTLTDWLTEHRGITFDPHQGVMSLWPGSTNVCAVFFLTGDTSSVAVTGMNIYVPPTAGADALIPVVFSMVPNYKGNQALHRDMHFTSEFFALPHDLTFSNITLDGTYMGWVGNAYDVVVTNVQSRRYGDLEDAKGDNVGGVDKWFAPPHLFYWSVSSSTDPLLVNNHISIANVVDKGIRLGTARDKGGSDPVSGYANSLKIYCTTCSVDGYTSARPDGFMDVGTTDGLTVSDVTATYNSSFTHNIYPGWRFPSSSYIDARFENISLTDLAAVTTVMPIGHATETNHGIVFSNVRVAMHAWAGQGSPLPPVATPAVANEENSVSLVYSIGNTKEQIVHFQTPYVQTTIEARSVAVTAGSATVLTYSSRQAAGCSPSGAWSGVTGTNGTRTVKLSAAGSFNFNLTCVNGRNTASAAVRVAVTP